MPQWFREKTRESGVPARNAGNFRCRIALRRGGKGILWSNKKGTNANGGPKGKNGESWGLVRVLGGRLGGREVGGGCGPVVRSCVKQGGGTTGYGVKGQFCDDLVESSFSRLRVSQTSSVRRGEVCGKTEETVRNNLSSSNGWSWIGEAGGWCVARRFGLRKSWGMVTWGKEPSSDG